jgi:F-type H+-transporting ATPase subunit alpha
MMELLKQWVFSPIPVEKQVCAIYAGSRWHLESIEVNKVLKFERDLYSQLDEEKTILESIREKKEITEETESKLIEVIKKVVELNS